MAVHVMVMAKYRFLEAGLNQAPSKYKTPSRSLLRAICVYEQTGEEAGQVKDLQGPFLPRFCAPNSTFSGKVTYHYRIRP